MISSEIWNKYLSASKFFKDAQICRASAICSLPKLYGGFYTKLHEKNVSLHINFLHCLVSIDVLSIKPISILKLPHVYYYICNCRNDEDNQSMSAKREADF